MIKELQGLAKDTIRTPVLILSCADCNRSVKVFGKVSRVLCACGQVLLENPSVPVPQGTCGISAETVGRVKRG